MKKLQKLKLNKEITPLSETEKHLLKGGFEDIDLQNNMLLINENENCSKQNLKDYCKNTNCECECKQSPDAGTEGPTWGPTGSPTFF